MKILMLLIGEYQWLCWTGFTVIVITPLTCFILRNENKEVAKPKKIRYSKYHRRSVNRRGL